MKIDIHVHTDFSRCSRFGFERFAEIIGSRGIRAVTVTDHGFTDAWERLMERNGDGLLIIPGVEVKARQGDFLVFSTDADYIKSLGPYRQEVKLLRRDAETAVVWAHPRIASATGWQAPPPDHHLIDEVAPHIDAIEVMNHNMMHDRSLTQPRAEYCETLAAIARERGLAATGGSDAHSESAFFACWTEFPDDTASIGDFINAIKSGNIRPACAESVLDSRQE